MPASLDLVEEHLLELYQPVEEVPEELPPAPQPPRKLKLKALSYTEPSQPAGLSMADVAICRSILQKLMKSKHALMFKAPVGSSSLLSSVRLSLWLTIAVQIPSSRARQGSFLPST